MIRFEQALEQILERIHPMPITDVGLDELLGCVIAAPVMAKIDSPPFDNSAVDGFGVRIADVASASEAAPVKLPVKAVIRAGDAGQQRLGARSAFKILTGACVPPTVDAVIMKEFCEERDGHVFVKSVAEPGENIRRRGGEFLRGQKVLSAGKLATPAVVALIASLGYSSFPAYWRPRAAVIATGNELTKQGRNLLPGKIYDSNSHAMRACLHSLGIADVMKTNAGEDLNATKRAFERALRFADVVISTGGVSVGDYDYVKEALEQLGVETHVWRIAIKPGKPVYFGVLDSPRSKRRKYVFGLPGNPVSALVTFAVLVAPAVAKLMGNTAGNLWMQARLTAPLKKKAGRMEFVRGTLTTNEEGNLVVTPTTGQDSHMLSGLANANALIQFPLEAEQLETGQSVSVCLLNWHQPQ